MAESEVRKEEPMSLNQRHRRLLHDVSNLNGGTASVDVVKLNSKVVDDADVPKFCGIVDFDSPVSAGEGIKSSNPGRVRKDICIEPSDHGHEGEDDVPHFSGITDFDSLSPVADMAQMTEMSKNVDRVALSKLGVSETTASDVGETTASSDESITTGANDPKSQPEMSLKFNSQEGLSSNGYSDGENRASLGKHITSTFNSFNFHQEAGKPSKVKIEGRRRLCKLSHDDHNVDALNLVVDDENSLSSVAEFNSTTPTKYAPADAYNGGDEIRDILSNLSSRLESLSIKKSRGLVEPLPDSSALFSNEGTSQPKTREFPGYTSVAPSFTRTLDESDSLSELTAHLSEMKAGKTKKPDGKKKTNQATADRKVLSTFRAIPSIRCDDEDDECIVTSGQNFVKKAESRRGRARLDSDDSILLDDDMDNCVSGDQNSIVLSNPNFRFTLPSKIAQMLYPHQREGLKWLWSLHCKGKGGILGDDMGLGKTMQICGFLAGLFHSRLVKRVMIVAPKTLLPHWMKEMAAVGLSGKIREYFGTCAKAREYELQYVLQGKGVLLTTYDIVRNNVKSLRGDHYFRNDTDEYDFVWDYMILDEGHLIKNPSTQRAKSLLEIPSAHRIIISGTPLQNNLKELWALFNFCCPELLGDKHRFKLTYEIAILKGNEKNASERDKRIGSAVAQDLRSHIQPYFLRRLKSEVFHEDNASDTKKLSKKNEIIVWLRLTGCQRKLYEAFLKSELVLSAFDGSPLAALTILKKICDHPLLLTKRAAEDVLEGMESMLNKEDHGVAQNLAMHIADVAEGFDIFENHDTVSCKISFILSLLDNLLPEGHSVLIFSQTRKMLNLIQDSLVSRGYDFLRIDGTTKPSDRLKIVNDFQEGMGAPIFLLTSQVGGLGLTLTKADRVIVVDPAWNPSTDNQSVDRAYRIGQTKDVLVYRLMTCGTVEEKIYRKQIYKGGLFKSATEHKEQIRYFSQQDLRELFSLPKQGFDISLTQQQLHEEHDSEHKTDSTLKAHIKFLESLGIAGISHHSLLFSKTAPVAVEQLEEVSRVKQSTFVGSTSSSLSSHERDCEGAQYAFNPKDVDLQRKTFSKSVARKQTESEIKASLTRLNQVLSNKALLSQLPDKGEKVRRQIVELNMELDTIEKEKRSEQRDCDQLEDMAGNFYRVVNV